MRLLNDNFKYKEGKNVYGLTKELDAIYITNFFQKEHEDVLVLSSSLYEANTFYKSIQAYTKDVLFFPMDDFLTSVALAISPDLKIKRLETLNKLKNESKPHIIVTSLMGYLKYLPSKNFSQSIIISRDSKNISREIITEELEEFGYHRDSLVTTTGEYAVRGYIIDVFPIDQDRPIRIEFFGDDIETIKTFDEETQRTLKEIKEIEIKRFNENVDDDAVSILDYMHEKNVFLIDELQIKSSYQALKNEMFTYIESKELDPQTKFMFDYEDLRPSKVYKIDTIDAYNQNSDSINYYSKEIENFKGDLDLLKTFVTKQITKNTIIFALDTDKQIAIIKDIFDEVIITNEDNIIEGSINIIKANYNRGFIFQNIILIAPSDIDKSLQKDIKYKNTIKIGRKVKTFNDLEVGDYIVHITHGVGIYRGLKTLKQGEYKKDYIELEYKDKDKVYISIDNIDKLYKYTSAAGTTPKLDKLNSTSWARKVRETKKRIRDISGELIELYASRTKITGPAYKDFDEEIKFAFNFPYVLTDDQEKAINDINLDLKSKMPMDRLLCGDVGYGKTEVAFRGMFKTVMNGYQVSYLCPTTILAKQQYNSALERFKDFPIRIELLSRHVTVKKTREILEDLALGKIDIVIGTHKLLNSKIKYKRLGLLVIDEEQRFGVSHKEKIKQLKNDINVLTLSATPIPRTLKMALSGLRSLSVLDTPPINRYPIQTYVIEENELIIRDAIYKELTRNGQIFILINNIEELDKYQNKISKLVPEATISIGHGRMSKEAINSVMEHFIDGKSDILICTTIIETGIDIPNVNTIIIIDADKFGLSQLYQIRGRVGRSDKIAYAYLMYNPAKVLTETATKRLESIKEFTELGSGYKIAMRDLAIRGAGDLLGSEQAGFIDAVGIDLYTKMLEEEVNKPGSIEEMEEEDTTPIFNISTHIKNEYVDDEKIKIEIHKLINSIKTKKDLERIKIELTDRFGKIDESMEIYMLEKCTENLMQELGITDTTQTSKRITITIPENISNQIDGEKLFMESYSINPKFEFSYKNKKISISLNTDNLMKNYIYYIYDLLTIIKNQTN